MSVSLENSTSAAGIISWKSVRGMCMISEGSKGLPSGRLKNGTSRKSMKLGDGLGTGLLENPSSMELVV